MNAQILFDSQSPDNTENWYIVDDVVMGGRSNGQLEWTKEGYAKFSGTISLENNGGFSSLRYVFEKTKVASSSKVRIHLKGDEKRYQFRVKSTREQYYSYITPFETTGDWEIVEFELGTLYPSFRGRRLDLPNFSHHSLEELTFLIGNKKVQKFNLLIKKIELID